MSELGSWDRDHLTLKVKDTYYLALYRKSVLALGLDQCLPHADGETEAQEGRGLEAPTGTWQQISALQV